GDEVGPSRGTLDDADLFRSARRRTGDVDEHDRQPVLAEGVRQRAGALHDLAGWVYGGETDDPFLQIDDDEGGLRVKRGQCHGVSPCLLVESRPLRESARPTIP